VEQVAHGDNGPLPSHGRMGPAVEVGSPVRAAVPVDHLVGAIAPRCVGAPPSFVAVAVVTVVVVIVVVVTAAATAAVSLQRRSRDVPPVDVAGDADPCDHGRARQGLPPEAKRAYRLEVVDASEL
jgi:hypothetical protein